MERSTSWYKNALQNEEATLPTFAQDIRKMHPSNQEKVLELAAEKAAADYAPQTEVVMTSWDSGLGWTDILKSDFVTYENGTFFRLNCKEERADQAAVNVTVSLPLDKAESYLQACLTAVQVKRAQIAPVAPTPERFRGEHSLHAEEHPEKCPGGHHAIWRTVECGGAAGDDRDIVECSRCGQQRNVRCNFDEEYC